MAIVETDVTSDRTIEQIPIGQVPTDLQPGTLPRKMRAWVIRRDREGRAKPLKSLGRSDDLPLLFGHHVPHDEADRSPPFHAGFAVRQNPYRSALRNLSPSHAFHR